MSTQSAQRQSTSSSGPASGSGSGGSTTQTAFEFTKRKRWADLLITELADTCIFILSSTCKILYCNPAVNELLGWKEADVIDHEFTELVNLEDQDTFQASFNESLGGRHELLAYIRLKCGTPATAYLPIKEILFEIKGYPRFVVENNPNSGCQCFFAMAKPYLSRNTAMLNTLMELKLENEHLQSKLVALKHSSSPSSNSNSLYSTSSALFSSTASSSPQQQHQADTSSNPYYLGHGSDTVKSPIKTAFDPSALSLSSANANAMANGNGDEDVEEGSKKKKLKKSHPSEQYVCNQCGRTDSPEWRKGPLGPKTLCNACGLRWAKQMRKVDDPTEPPQAQTGAGDGTGSASETG